MHRRLEASVSQRLTIAAALCAVGGCASVQSPATAWKVEPVMTVRHGEESSEAYYRLGRYHDGSRAWNQSIDAYRKAIAADPRNVEAYNALGVALAQCKRWGEAEAVLREAALIDPGSARVHSNLGLVLLLAGHAGEAVPQLQTALTQDPDNATARANLQWAMAALPPQGHDGTAASTAPLAPVAASVAAAAGGSDLRVIDAPTVPAWPVSMSDGATLTAAPVPETAAEARLPAPKVAATAPAAPAVRLEVVNGNGVSGAATKLKRRLTAEGLAVTRVSNWRPYRQQYTVIEYRIGQREAAQRVARMLDRSVTVTLVAVPGAAWRSDVRVVLGRDWSRTGIAPAAA